MKKLLLSVSALSLLAAPVASLAQDGGDRAARRAARQAERAGGGEDRDQRRAERETRRSQRQAAPTPSAAPPPQYVDNELARRDAAARAQAEENQRRVEAGQPRVGEDRVRRADRRWANDDRQDRREDRQDWRQDRREDRRDYREDRREDRRDWRQDQRRRTWSYQGRNYNAFRVAPYRWAPGYSRFSFGIGTILPSPFLSQTYAIRDYWNYGLPRPPAGTYWLRVDTDVLLVDRRGRVRDVIRDVFYWDDGYGGW